MAPAAPSPAELEYWYHGFARALRRYRTATVLGWLIVLAGVAGVPLGWRAAGSHGALDLLLCGGTIVAGLLLVSECVSFLHAYIAVPFPLAPADTEAVGPLQVLEELRALMHDVDAGGWQEAYAAIARLETIGARHGLPPPGDIEHPSSTMSRS